jgi:hypothetical protein
LFRPIGGQLACQEPILRGFLELGTFGDPSCSCCRP